MAKFRVRSAIIEATQWFKNGDHPDDFAAEKVGYENGELRTWTGAEVKANGWEGQVVRYYRHPAVDGTSICSKCGATMHAHGWIDTIGGGEAVCPGDYVITADDGGRYTRSEHDFFKTYESVK